MKMSQVIYYGIDLCLKGIFVILVFEMSPPEKGLKHPIFKPSGKFLELLPQQNPLTNYTSMERKFCEDSKNHW